MLQQYLCAVLVNLRRRGFAGLLSAVSIPLYHPLTWRNLDGPGPAKPALRPNRPSLPPITTASLEGDTALDAATAAIGP